MYHYTAQIRAENAPAVAIEHALLPLAQTNYMKTTCEAPAILVVSWMSVSKILPDEFQTLVSHLYVVKLKRISANTFSESHWLAHTHNGSIMETPRTTTEAIIIDALKPDQSKCGL